MKKIYYLMAALSVVFLASCSDDDDDNSFNHSFNGEKLALKLNNYELKGSTVQLTTDDYKNGTVLLKDLIPGEKEIQIPVSVSNEAVSQESAYTFTGENKTDGRQIAVKGTFTGTAQMELEVSYKVLSKLVGAWKPMGMMDAATTIDLVITPVTEDATINMCGVLKMDEIPLTGEGSFKNIIALMSKIVFANMIDFELHMQESGYLVAKWAPAQNAALQFPAGESKNGMVRFNVVNNQVFIALSPAIIAAIRASEPGLAGITTLGLPLNIKIEEGKITASVTKDMMKPYLTIVGGILKALLVDVEFGPQALAMGINGENLSALYDQIAKSIIESPQFDLHINMQAL